MSAKDLTEKILLNYNDVFADIVNALVFTGEQRIVPDSLEDKIVHAQYKAEDGKLHEVERDIFKTWKACGIEIAMCGLENQTNPFKFMPARTIGYDGAAYREQILDKNRKILVPVVTIVLHFGNERWNEPRSLKELFGEYPAEFEEYINDYQIHLFEIAWLSDEEISRFKSDFKVVANFFVKKRKDPGYIPDDPQEIEHVDAVLKLLSVMTGDKRYMELPTNNKEGRISNMCDVAERLENKGIAIGEARGITKGQAKEKAETLERVTRNYMEMDPSLSYEEAKKKAEYILR